MIDLRQPLGHAMVVGVFGLKRESVATTKNSAGKLLAVACEPHVCPDLPQGEIAVGDQPNAEVVIPGHRLRRAEGGPNYIVIQEGRPHGELGLLQGQKAVMVPGRLPKGGKRKRMRVRDSAVGFASLGKVREQIRSKKSRSRRSGLEHPQPSKDLITIVAGHPDRSNLPRLLAPIEDRRTAHVSAAIREVHRSLGVIGKAGDKLLAATDHLMRLPASASHLPRHQHIATFTVRSPKGVTRERAWGRLVPGHDRPCVQSPGQ